MNRSFRNSQFSNKEVPQALEVFLFIPPMYQYLLDIWHIHVQVSILETSLYEMKQIYFDIYLILYMTCIIWDSFRPLYISLKMIIYLFTTTYLDVHTIEIMVINNK